MVDVQLVLVIPEAKADQLTAEQKAMIKGGENYYKDGKWYVVIPLKREESKA